MPIKPSNYEFDSLADGLDIIRPLVAPQLIGKTQWKAIYQRVGHLPGFASDGWVGFEIRLSDPYPGADMALRASPDSRFASWIIKSGTMLNPAAALKEIVREESPLSVTRDLVLEFDFIEPGKHPDECGFFFANMWPGDVTDLERYVCAGAETVGQPLNSADLKLLRMLSENFPEGGWLAFLGFMLNRELAGMRLAIVLELTKLESFLGLIGWPGTLPKEIKEMCEKVSLGGFLEGRCLFHLDIADGRFGPKVGIECKLGHWLSVMSSKYSDAFRSFTELGWCLPEKAAALSQSISPCRHYGKSGSMVARGGVAHLKFVMESDGKISAKAYMGFGFVDV